MSNDTSAATVVSAIRRNSDRAKGHVLAIRRALGMAGALCLLCVFGSAGVLIDLVHLSRVGAWLRGQTPVYSIRDLHAHVVGISWACSFVFGTLCVGLLANRATGSGEVMDGK